MSTLSLQEPWLSASSARRLKRQKQYERKRLEKQPLQQKDKCRLSSVLPLTSMLDCSQEKKLVNRPIHSLLLGTSEKTVWPW